MSKWLCQKCGFVLLFNIVIASKMYSQAARLQRTMLLLLLLRTALRSVGSAAGCGDSGSSLRYGRQGPLLDSHRQIPMQGGGDLRKAPKTIIDSQVTLFVGIYTPTAKAM